MPIFAQLFGVGVSDFMQRLDTSKFFWFHGVLNNTTTCLMLMLVAIQKYALSYILCMLSNILLAEIFLDVNTYRFWFKHKNMNLGICLLIHHVT